MVVKAAFRRDLSEGEVPALRQSDRVLNAKAKDELMRRYADRTPEEPREMEWTDVRSLRQGQDGEVLAEVRVDEVDYASQLIRIQLESRRRYFRAGNAICRQQVKDEPDRQRVDVETASTRFGEHLAMETLSVSGEDRIVDRSLADEFDVIRRQVFPNDVGHELRVEHQRESVECPVPSRRIEFAVRQEMRLARIDRPVSPAASSSPSERNRVGSGADADAVTDDVVQGKFVRRKAMPLNEDSAPPKRPTAAQQGMRGYRGERNSNGGVDQRVFAGGDTHERIAFTTSQCSLTP